MSGHAPQVLHGAGHGWVHCECGWHSGLVRHRRMTNGMAASLAWALHLAEVATRRARRAG